MSRRTYADTSLQMYKCLCKNSCDIIFTFAFVQSLLYKTVFYLTHTEARNNSINRIDCVSTGRRVHTHIHASKVAAISCVRSASESLHSCAGESGMMMWHVDPIWSSLSSTFKDRRNYYFAEGCKVERDIKI